MKIFKESQWLFFACISHFFMIKREVLSEENYEARQRLEWLRATNNRLLGGVCLTLVPSKT